jgi:hypothetical protein
MSWDRQRDERISTLRKAEAAIYKAELLMDTPGRHFLRIEWNLNQHYPEEQLTPKLEEKEVRLANECHPRRRHVRKQNPHPQHLHSRRFRDYVGQYPRMVGQLLCFLAG